MGLGDVYKRQINIDLPPLRSREQDVLEIADAFLKGYSAKENKNFIGFDQEASQALLSHSWPGNVRELQNLVQRTVVMQSGGEISKNMLPDNLAEKQLNNTASAVNKVQPQPSKQNLPDDIKPLWLVEKEAIEHAIEICNGGIPKAAALLDVSPSTIYRKIQAWEEKSV